MKEKQKKRKSKKLPKDLTPIDEAVNDIDIDVYNLYTTMYPEDMSDDEKYSDLADIFNLPVETIKKYCNE